jgi:hypothetical protein
LYTVNFAIKLRKIMQATAKRLFPSRPVVAWTDVTFLAAVGLLASWVDTILIANDSSNSVIDFQAPRPPFYYYVHGAALLAVMAAGLLAALKGRFRVLGFVGRIAFLALAVTAAGWAATSYTVEEMFSRTIFGVTGPFIWFTLIFVLVGTNRRVWTVIDPVIRVLAYATSVLALFAVISSKGSFYYSGQLSKYTQYSILLMWLSGWTLLSATRLRGWRLAVRAAPFFTMLLVAIYSQARSWTALTVLLGLVFVILRAREEGSALAGARMVVLSGVLIAAVGVITYDSVFRSALEGLAGRVHEDTRTGEYVAFFSAVPVSDLLLGRGPKGTWYQPGIGKYQFFDNGFLWIAFIGGLPTLLSYVAIIVWPAVRMIQKNPRGQDAAAACLVLLWGLVLTGFGTYAGPSVTLSSYLVSLLAGRCYLGLAERTYYLGNKSSMAIFPRSRLQQWQRVRAMR